jgi:hypothetical protein
MQLLRSLRILLPALTLSGCIVYAEKVGDTGPDDENGEGSDGTDGEDDPMDDGSDDGGEDSGDPGDDGGGDDGGDDGSSVLDTDGDGWLEPDDCDDDDPDVNPDADEICSDGIDNNCDGEPTGCGLWDDQSVDEAAVVLRGEAAGDRLGQGDPGAGRAGDVNGDGIDDLIVSAIFESSVASRQGAVYIVHGPVESGGSIGDVAAAKLSGDDANDWAGYAVAGAGDVDGDGYDDLFIGATRDDSSGADAGISYLVRGPVTADADLATRADVAFTGAAAGEISGEVSWLGDVDGDALPDLLVGAQWSGEAAFNAGAAYVVTGLAAASGTVSLASATHALLGVAAEDEASSSLAGIGDTDGDGLADIAVGARGVDAGGADAGAVYVVTELTPGVSSLASATAVLSGEGDGAEVGWGASVSAAGDVNADGYADFIVGARSDSEGGDNAGAAYVVFGPVSPGSRSLATADAKLLGETAGNFTGDSVGDAGDVDGDGYDDVLVGSGYNSAGAEEGGAAYLVRGPTTGTVSLSTATARLRASAQQDRLRTRGAGDLNNDGLDDIFVTAQLADDGDAADAGAIYLFEGIGG